MGGAFNKTSFLQDAGKVFEHALAFKKGEGDKARYLIFFPGNSDYPWSKDHRNAAERKLLKCNEHMAELELNTVRSERKTVTLFPESSKTQGSCLEADHHFGALAAMLTTEKLTIIPVVECKTFVSRDVFKLMETFSRQKDCYIPAYVNGVGHEQKNRPVKKQQKIVDPPPASPPIAKTHPAKTAPKPRGDRTNESALKLAMVAYPQEDRLSLFAPTVLALGTIREKLQEPLGLAPDQLKAINIIEPEDKRYPLIRGMQQIALPISEPDRLPDTLKALHDIGFPVVAHGHPLPLAELQRWKADRAAHIAKEEDKKRGLAR